MHSSSVAFASPARHTARPARGYTLRPWVDIADQTGPLDCRVATPLSPPEDPGRCIKGDPTLNFQRTYVEREPQGIREPIYDACTGR